MLREIVEGINENMIEDTNEDTNEDIKIVKKTMKYVGKNNYSWRINFYNTKEHSFLDKVNDRTDYSFKYIENKVSRGIDYLLKRWKNGKIKSRVTIALTFTESNFKVVYGLNPIDKFMTVITILDKDMKTSKAIKWNIDENIKKIIENFGYIIEKEILE